MMMQDLKNLAGWPSKTLRELRAQYRVIAHMPLHIRVMDEAILAGVILAAEAREFYGWTAAVCAWMQAPRRR